MSRQDELWDRNYETGKKVLTSALKSNFFTYLVRYHNEFYSCQFFQDSVFCFGVYAFGVVKFV